MLYLSWTGCIHVLFFLCQLTAVAAPVDIDLYFVLQLVSLEAVTFDLHISWSAAEGQQLDIAFW